MSERLSQYFVNGFFGYSKVGMILSFLCFNLGGASISFAANVVLPAHSADICVGKSRKLIQLKQQAEYWKCNGKTSSLSTFQYAGNFSILTLDYATADVMAQCKTAGSETYQLEWMLAFNDPNVYSINYTVNCKICPNPRLAMAQAVRGDLKVVSELTRGGRFAQAMVKIEDSKLGIELESYEDTGFRQVFLMLAGLEKDVEMKNQELIQRDIKQTDQYLIKNFSE